MGVTRRGRLGALWAHGRCWRLLVGLPLHDAATHGGLAARRLAPARSFVRTTASVALGAAWALPPAF